MNSILGLLASGPLLIVMILMVGLVSPSKAMERIEGVLVLAAVVLVFVAANYLLYRLLKRKKGKECQTDNRKIFLRFLLFFAAVTAGIAAPFIFQEIWLFLNGWWF